MKKLIAALLVLFVSALPGKTEAAVGMWSVGGPVQARLISAVDAVGTGETLPLALEVRLAPGWKTYWRTPGDAGLPPTLDWTGSENLKSAELLYPAPSRFTVLGFETIGYDKEVTFPLRATVSEPGKPASLRARLDILACEKICVPQRLDLALKLPSGPAVPGPDMDAVARAVARVPGDGAAAGLSLTGLRLVNGVLEVAIASTAPFGTPDVFAETDPPIAFKAPLARSEGKNAVLWIEPAEPLPAGETLDGQPVTLTIVDGERSAEFRVAANVPPSKPGLPAILPAAVLGGLILNLMPCVLPVLSLKLLAIIGLSGQASRTVRAGFLASAAGILVSFLALAAMLAGLKAAGASVGWGIQFQQPLFLAVMAVVVTLFAANLWGLFDIALPGFVGSRVDGREGPGLAGSFVSGMLATVLATPCSAPFLGTAVGFALAGGTADIFAVFIALGLGLAMPWLVVAAAPALAGCLPRPGRWVLTLRRALGGVLALTILWLLRVLGASAGMTTTAVVGGMMAGLVVSLWVRRQGPRLAGSVAAAVLAVSALGVAGAPMPPAATTARIDFWIPFDETAIGAAVASGKTVLVEATADWCLTCLANERLVLDSGIVADRLSGGNAVAMRADWTRADASISRFLAAHGRYGVPFTIVYGPRAPAGRPLPELLTVETVLKALDSAK